MKSQDPEFDADSVPQLAGLAAGDSDGNSDVAQMSGVFAIRPPFRPRAGRPGRLPKRQDVGRLVLAAIVAIEPPHGPIGHEGDAKTAPSDARRGAFEPRRKPSVTHAASGRVGHGHQERS